VHPESRIQRIGHLSNRPSFTLKLADAPAVAAGRNLGTRLVSHLRRSLADRRRGYPVTRFSSEPSPPTINQRGCVMGAQDKASNKIDDLGGKAKEALGKVTGDKDTENTGKVDQAKSNLKDAGEKIKDAFKN
jgi:uncharacterized protein YjbJ (UPF0337 family)